MATTATSPPLRYATDVDPTTGLSLREFVAQARDGHSVSTVSRGARLAYSTLFRHVRQKLAISPKNALKLQRWSKGRISAAKTLGL